MILHFHCCLQPHGRLTSEPSLSTLASWHALSNSIRLHLCITGKAFVDVNNLNNLAQLRLYNLSLDRLLVLNKRRSSSSFSASLSMSMMLLLEICNASTLSGSEQLMTSTFTLLPRCHGPGVHPPGQGRHLNQGLGKPIDVPVLNHLLLASISGPSSSLMSEVWRRLTAEEATRTPSSAELPMSM